MAIEPDLLAAGLFAPVVVWLLWRGQTLSVELLRLRLLVLTRHGNQRWIYSTVSWFGTLLHEISHATVLLLSGHGIREFRAGVETGHVTPATMRKGPLSFLFFLVAALAPLFIPPALVLALLFFFVDETLFQFTSGGPGLQAAWDLLVAFGADFPLRLLRSLANLDLAQPAHIAILAATLLGIPGARPSHVTAKGKKEGDVAVLRARIRENPLPFIAFLILLYAASFLTLLWPAAYWLPLQAVWAIATTGTVLALVGALWWSLAGLDGRVTPWLAWGGFAAFVAVQLGARFVTLPASITLVHINGAALAAWLVVSLGLGAVARRR
ncbi:MAG: hypothetical protein AABX89_06460 [Candidatus Thermoplasmatota archaeon]